MSNKVNINETPLVILAGGLGSRLSEETMDKPKPMVNIGPLPIIHHIMNYYSHFGVKKFIICCGYRGDYIKNYFLNYRKINSDFTINYESDNIIYHNNPIDKWSISLIDTGMQTNTGGRLKKILKYVQSDNFFMTYGDGLSNINIHKLAKFHENHNSQVTVSAVKPLSRFGSMVLSKDDKVKSFREKNTDMPNEYINAGYFVINKEAIKEIKNSRTSWEFDTMPIISNKKNLMAYKHKGFWQCMDNIREKNLLEDLYYSGKAPWIYK